MAEILRFFSLTYAVSWACAAAAVATSRWTALSAFAGLAAPLLAFGIITPSLVALALTARADGRAGVLALLRPILAWRVGARWYLFALGYVAAVKLVVALVHRVAIGEWPPFGNTAWFIILPAIVVSTWAQAGEEIGWRGYALPRLAACIGLARASIVLGAIWACWHLPVFFIPGSDNHGQSFPVYVLGVTALSVALAWLFWRTGGSLLLVMLMHAAVNNTNNIVPSSVPGATNPLTLSASAVAWLTVALLWGAAAYFLIRMGGATLHRARQAPRDGRMDAAAAASAARS